jgi:spore coat polysaccharide biosynthesis protein SpsF (cytidylyltransferase family)
VVGLFIAEISLSILLMNIGIIIQARLSSQRLLNKVIRPIFMDKSILDIIIMRLKKMNSHLPIIIATGDFEKNKELFSYASQNNILFFSGSEDDVLERFIQCSKEFKLQKVLRVCADNPFLDYQLAENLISISLSGGYDYVSYSVNNKPAILSHYGFFSEAVSYNGLVKAHSKSANDSDKEHVTPYIYNHPEEFSLMLKQAPIEITNEEKIRLTVDTETDFENAAKILENVVAAKGDFSYSFKDVLAVVRDMDDSVKQSMSQQILINSKS